MTWPPEDAPELLARWEALGRPAIELSPGVTVSNLERWLYPLFHSHATAKDLALVRLRLALAEAGPDDPEAQVVRRRLGEDAPPRDQLALF